MGIFDDREKGMENKYFHDAEMKFKAMARRNKLFGLWIAGLIGKTGKDADDYAKSVIKADLEEAGDEDVLRKVTADIKAAHVSKSDAELRLKLDECLAEAIRQLEAE